jgi:hypothetical protein
MRRSPQPFGDQEDAQEYERDGSTDLDGAFRTSGAWLLAHHDCEGGGADHPQRRVSWLLSPSSATKVMPKLIRKRSPPAWWTAMTPPGVVSRIPTIP